MIHQVRLSVVVVALGTCPIQEGAGLGCMPKGSFDDTRESKKGSEKEWPEYGWRT